MRAGTVLYLELNPQGSNSHRTELISDHLFLRKKKFWNAAIASGERIRSPKN